MRWATTALTGGQNWRGGESSAWPTTLLALLVPEPGTSKLDPLMPDVELQDAAPPRRPRDSLITRKLRTRPPAVGLRVIWHRDKSAALALLLINAHHAANGEFPPAYAEQQRKWAAKRKARKLLDQKAGAPPAASA